MKQLAFARTNYLISTDAGIVRPEVEMILTFVEPEYNALGERQQTASTVRFSMSAVDARSMESVLGKIATALETIKPPEGLFAVLEDTR